LADDHRGLPPALVVTAGFDPLRDEGAAYADALQGAGVPVTYRCYDDQVHGFISMGIVPDTLALTIEVLETMGQMVRAAADAVAS
jgi:acetyl esterase